MHHIFKVLGGHPVYGVLAVLVMGVAFFAWEYLRLAGPTRWSAYLPLVQRIAMVAAMVSVLLIVSRFLAVENL